MLNMAVSACSLCSAAKNRMMSCAFSDTGHRMKRFLVLIFILMVAAFFLFPLIFTKSDVPSYTGAYRLSAERLPLEEDHPARDDLGQLHFIAAWSLKGDVDAFGGLSSLLVQPDGSLLALNDTGLLTTLGRPPAGGNHTIRPLPVFRAERNWSRFVMDSESMVVDPATGRHWVGFELQQRICRYAPGFVRVEKCRVWPEIRRWPATGGPEAMVRLATDQFLVFSEMGDGPDQGNEVLLFSGDPVEASTPHPVRMNYVPPQGYRPTESISIGGGRVLVMNRRATIFDGFTAVLTVLDVSHMKPHAILRPVEIARFAPPVLSDNLEGMAIEKRAGRTILWIVSDDNHEFFQRTLLFAFALPPELSRR
jgi:hypothetical protein